ncbi:hypothetical protein EIN_253000 [Entamoeba invadens IP1]|uniref:Uncharacterized protein n=1 Tax=Entamoeba invadens IP1 TaxID=370355 RepID=A0A0A1UEN8_ENTIV|nr:hypothetical protein EIN_253000 [Entamoeba invadens IP1]ELP95046.1 hypothetical protein EIN_253000 [Entamoeba invadens IP1]|eukprot:XP_004261817.1 hypothetical protein EIN_253000 [Entamoeba invadens IP1]
MSLATAQRPQKHHDERNLLTEVECVLLALLSRKYGFVLSKPQKKSTTAKQFVKVRTLVKENEEYEFELQKFIKARTYQRVEKLQKEGFPLKTARRKTQSIKRSEALYIFEDLLLEFGYIVFFEKINREGINGDVQIFCNGKFVYGKDDIRTIGNKVSGFLTQRLGNALCESVGVGELCQFCF